MQTVNGKESRGELANCIDVTSKTDSTRDQQNTLTQSTDTSIITDIHHQQIAAYSQTTLALPSPNTPPPTQETECYHSPSTPPTLEFFGTTTTTTTTRAETLLPILPVMASSPPVQIIVSHSEKPPTFTSTQNEDMIEFLEELVAKKNQWDAPEKRCRLKYCLHGPAKHTFVNINHNHPQPITWDELKQALMDTITSPANTKRVKHLFYNKKQAIGEDTSSHLQMMQFYRIKYHPKMSDHEFLSVLWRPLLPSIADKLIGHQTDTLPDMITALRRIDVGIKRTARIRDHISLTLPRLPRGRLYTPHTISQVHGHGRPSISGKHRLPSAVVNTTGRPHIKSLMHLIARMKAWQLPTPIPLLRHLFCHLLPYLSKRASTPPFSRCRETDNHLHVTDYYIITERPFQSLGSALLEARGAEQGSLHGQTSARSVRALSGRQPVADLKNDNEKTFSPPTKANWFNPRPGHSEFSQVGIMQDKATGRLVFLRISHFPHPCIPALLHSYLISLSLALKTSLRAAQISQLNSDLGYKMVISCPFAILGILALQSIVPELLQELFTVSIELELASAFVVPAAAGRVCLRCCDGKVAVIIFPNCFLLHVCRKFPELSADGEVYELTAVHLCCAQQTLGELCAKPMIRAAA
ncbi:hypothetical protein PR048_012644, partial [Dryococelus australis]